MARRTSSSSSCFCFVEVLEEKEEEVEVEVFFEVGRGRRAIEFFFFQEKNQPKTEKKTYLRVREERDQFGPGPLLAQGQRNRRQSAHGVEAQGDVLVLELVTVCFLKDFWKRVSIDSSVVVVVSTESAPLYSRASFRTDMRIAMGYRLSSPETPAPVAAGASAPPRSMAVAILPPVSDEAALATTERKKGSPGESGGAASFPWGLGCFSGV